MRLSSKLVAASLLLIVSAGAVSAAQVDVESGFTQPSEVEAGSTVQNQLFNVNIHSLSADGDTDYVYFQFPNEFEGNLSLNSIDSNISVSSSKTLVDYDNDSVEETAKVGLSRDGEGNVTGNVTLDATVSYSPEFDQAEVNVEAVDSSNGEDSATLEVVDMEEETSDSQDNTSDTEESTDTDETENDSTSEETDSTDETDTENNTTTDDEQSDSVDESEGDSTDNNQTTDEETDTTEENEGTQTDGTDNESTSDNTDSEGTDSQESSGDQGIIASIVSFFTGLF